MVAKAEATYDDRRASASTSSGRHWRGGWLMGLASWMNVQSEREDENRSERTRKEGDRMIHEKSTSAAGATSTASWSAIGFMVSAEGNGVDIGALKSGVNSVDLRQARVDEIGLPLPWERAGERVSPSRTHLLERVRDFHEVGLVRHHLVDRLVGSRNLVDHGRVLAALDRPRSGARGRRCEKWLFACVRLMRRPAPCALEQRESASALAAHDE